MPKPEQRVQPAPVQSTALASTGLSAATIEKVVIGGDLRPLTPAERLAYYGRLCESLGLNPLTKPFEYLELSGKLTLYARKDATDQLRKLHTVSTEIVSAEHVGDLYVVVCRARTPDGRVEEEMGAVTTANAKGEALANVCMKAVTKSKRRATLAICGLGALDESEVDSVPHARVVDVDDEGAIREHEQPKALPRGTAAPQSDRRALIAEAVALREECLAVGLDPGRPQDPGDTGIRGWISHWRAQLEAKRAAPPAAAASPAEPVEDPEVQELIDAFENPVPIEPDAETEEDFDALRKRCAGLVDEVRAVIPGATIAVPSTDDPGEMRAWLEAKSAEWQASDRNPANKQPAGARR